MKASKYDGQRIIHIDGAMQEHSGIVVGQSDNGQQVYVQSDNPSAPPAQWHFTVSAALAPRLIRNAK